MTEPDPQLTSNCLRGEQDLIFWSGLGDQTRTMRATARLGPSIPALSVTWLRRRLQRQPDHPGATRPNASISYCLKLYGIVVRILGIWPTKTAAAAGYVDKILRGRDAD